MTFGATDVCVCRAPLYRLSSEIVNLYSSMRRGFLLWLGSCTMPAPPPTVNGSSRGSRVLSRKEKSFACQETSSWHQNSKAFSSAPSPSRINTSLSHCGNSVLPSFQLFAISSSSFTLPAWPVAAQKESHPFFLIHPTYPPFFCSRQPQWGGGEREVPLLYFAYPVSTPP